MKKILTIIASALVLTCALIFYRNESSKIPNAQLVEIAPEVRKQNGAGIETLGREFDFGSPTPSTGVVPKPYEIFDKSERVEDSKKSEERLMDKSRQDELAFRIAEQYMKDREVPYAGREHEVVNEGELSVVRYKAPKNVRGGDFIIKIDLNTGSVIDAKFYR